MKAIKQRPFAFACILFLLSSFLFFFIGRIATLIISLLSVLICGAMFLFKKKKKSLAFYILIPLIISSTVSFWHFGIVRQNILTYAEKECKTEFVITDIQEKGDEIYHYQVRIQKVDGKKTSFKALIPFTNIPEGELFSSHSATLIFYENQNGDEGYSYAFSELASGIYLLADLKGSPVSDQKTVKLFPDYYFKKANLRLAEAINKFIDGEAEALCEALLLGNKYRLSHETTQSFRALGLSHMLAVSGMHLSILIGSLNKLFERFNLHKKKRFALMAVLTLLYAGLTGFSPSVKRAAIMLIVYYLSFLIAEDHDSVTALCTAAALICLFSPNSIFDVGLWLSFLSTYGIITVGSPLTEQFKEKADSASNLLVKLTLKLTSALLFGVVPIMFSLPAIWLSYGELSVVSPITNLIFTPILQVIMYTCPFVMLFSPLPVLPQLIAFVTEAAANIMLFVSDKLAPYAPSVFINYSFTVYFILFLVLAFLFLAIKGVKKPLLYFVPLITAVLLFATSVGICNMVTAKQQKLIYSNTYKGDSFVVISQNKALFCDISGMSQNNALQCVKLLTQNKIKVLDGYVITDYKGNGTDTLNDLLSVYKIKTLYIPYGQTEDERLLEDEFARYAADKGIASQKYELTDDAQISFYGITLDVKRLSQNAVNSPSSICVTFSSDSKSLCYIGMGCYDTPYGRTCLSKLFKNNDTYIFGTYGKQSRLPKTELYFSENNRLYFPDSATLEFYQSVLNPNSELLLTTKNSTIRLN